MCNIIIQMTSGFYAIIWKGSLWFSLSFPCFCVSERKNERDHTMLFRSHSHQHSMEYSENVFSSCVIVSGHKMLKKDLLKLSLQSSKIHLARDLPSPHCLWNDLCKTHISPCLFPAKNHLKGPLPPTAGKD